MDFYLHRFRMPKKRTLAEEKRDHENNIEFNRLVKEKLEDLGDDPFTPEKLVEALKYANRVQNPETGEFTYDIDDGEDRTS
jgi:hypothetical protein